MSIPEILLHETRIPHKQLSLLLHYSKDQHWNTKDFHTISKELEEFIISLPESEQNIDELQYLLVKILFFSGNLNKLNEVYTSIIADNHEILGVTIFYALGLIFQGYSEEASQLINRIKLNNLNDPALKIEIMGIKLSSPGPLKLRMTGSMTSAKSRSSMALAAKEVAATLA